MRKCIICIHTYYVKAPYCYKGRGPGGGLYCLPIDCLLLIGCLLNFWTCVGGGSASFGFFCAGPLSTASSGRSKKTTMEPRPRSPTCAVGYSTRESIGNLSAMHGQYRIGNIISKPYKHIYIFLSYFSIYRREIVASIYIYIYIYVYTIHDENQ